MRTRSASPASRLVARRRADRGSVSVELAGFVLPAMLVAIVIVTAAFTLSISRLDLEAASAAAARAASLQRNPAAAVTAAGQAAEADLAGRSVTCATLRVDTDTSRWRRGGSVTVTVGCTVSVASLARMSGMPGSFTATSTSTAPIDTFRQLATGAPVPGGGCGVSL
jgi:Flp pilus assembly protein TadG